jgi:hypothetical protein
MDMKSSIIQEKGKKITKSMEEEKKRKRKKEVIK